MRTVIIGAGSVGRMTAGDLAERGHQVTLVDRDPSKIKVALVPDVEWVLGDACSPAVLEEVGARECDSVVAVTGDDKVNLVVSLLAKSEFGVHKVVARANHTSNEWMFNSNWGVDVVTSAPRSLSTLITAAVRVGKVVKVASVGHGAAGIYTVTVPAGSTIAGRSPGGVEWPNGLLLVAVTRDEVPTAPSAVSMFDVGDELLFVTKREQLESVVELEHLVQP